MIKSIKGDQAVAEELGTMLLIAICVVLFTVIYSQVLSNPGPPPEANITIVGKLESGNVVFEHRRGESLGMDTKIILNLGGIPYIMSIDDNPLLSMI